MSGLIGFVTGSTERREAAKKRAALLAALQDAHLEALDEIRGAIDLATVHVALAACWRRLDERRTFTSDNMGGLHVFDAPIFAEVPLRAIGLTRIEDGVWTGTSDLLMQVAVAMVQHGYVVNWAPDRESLALSVAGTHVAHLLVDPEFVAATPASVSKVKPDSVPGLLTATTALGLLAAALLPYAGQIVLAVIAMVVGLGALAARHVYMQRRLRRAPVRRHAVRVEVASIATAYRDPVQASLPNLATMRAELEASGFACKPAGRGLAIDGDVTLEPEGSSGRSLTVGFEDPYLAMRCLHRVVAMTGRLDVHWGRSTTSINSPDDYGAWEAQRRAEDAWRLEMASALAAAHSIAIARVKGTLEDHGDLVVMS